jgi:hypothetical protein
VPAQQITFQLCYSRFTHIEKFYLFLRNYAAANAALDELGALAGEKGATAWKTAEMTGRGRLMALGGKPSEAIQVLTPGLADAAQRSTGTTLNQPLNLLCLAHAHAELGQFDDAWRRIGEAITTMEKTKEKWCQAEVYRTAGEIALNRRSRPRRGRNRISSARSRLHASSRQNPGNFAPQGA